MEGSIAFTLSVVVFALLLRFCGLTEGFSVRCSLTASLTDIYYDCAQIAKYALVVGLSSLLEAFSVQNDNLIVPMYMWSMLVFTDF